MSSWIPLSGSYLRKGGLSTRRRRAKLFDFLARRAQRFEALAADSARVGRFLAGYSRFEPRESDIWIATYPRSGTTWSQYLLVLMHHGVNLEFEHIHDVSPWFERSLAVGSMLAQDLNALESPRIFKTHLPAAWVPERGRVLHVTRDGRDVARSYFGLYQKYLGYQGDFASFFARFLRGDLQYRSWFDFQRGWEERSAERNVLSIAYEAMRQDPAAGIREIARFLGVDCDSHSIDTLCAATDIGAMKANEHKFDHAALLLKEKGVFSGGFIREGKVGAGVEQLTLGQQREFELALRKSQSAPARVELRISAFLH